MTALASVARIVLEANGVELAEVARTLTAVRVQKRLSLPAQCELTFSAVRGTLDVAPEVQPGTSLRVLVRGHDLPLFEGQVTALEYLYEEASERLLRVRAYDLLHQLRKRQTVRAHIEVSVLDLAREFTADIGLGIVASNTAPVWPHVIQHHQSDFEFLAGLAERCGLFMAVREGNLHFFGLEGRGDSVALRLGENLIEARVELNGDSALRQVNASGLDARRVETHTGTASAARLGREVAAEVTPSRVGGSGERDLVNEAAPDEDHAVALAQAELDLRLAREVTFYGTAEGNPALTPGTPIDVQGLDEDVNGRYVLTSVTHTLDTSAGFLSELSTQPPPLTSRPHEATATAGIVTRVDDPDGLGRVRVKLPTFSDVETDWLGVLCPAAGPDKGLVALPDVDDRVLVLSLDGDPGRGFVLGGLYGATPPPDTGVEGGSIKRYTFVTPGGQLVRLDDDKDLMRLETGSGNFVEMAPGMLRVHAATDLTIEAPGHNVVVRGAAIDFESA